MATNLLEPSNPNYLTGKLKRLNGPVPFYGYEGLNEIIIAQQNGASKLGDGARERINALSRGELKPLHLPLPRTKIDAQRRRDDVFIPSHPEPDQLNRWLINPQDKARFRHALGGSHSPLLQPKMVFNISPAKEVVGAVKGALVNQEEGKSFVSLATFDPEFLDPASIVSITEFATLLASGSIPLPLYIKPTNSANGNGVVRISEEENNLVFTMVKTLKQTKATTEKVEAYFKASGIATSIIDPYSNVSTFKLDRTKLDIRNILPTIIHDLWIILSTEYNYEDKKENAVMRTMTVETEIDPLYGAGTHEIRLYVRGDLDSGKSKVLKHRGEISRDGRCSVARFNGSRFSNYSGRGDFTSDAEYDQMLDPIIKDCRIPATQRQDLYDFVERAGENAFSHLSERYRSRGIDTYSTNDALMEIDLQLGRASLRNNHTFDTPKGFTQAANIEGYLLEP